MKSMIPLCLSLCCCTTVFAANSDEGQLLIEGKATSADWRIHIGLAEGIDEISFGKVNGGADSDEHFSEDPGLSIDAEWLWNRLGYSRIGFVHGPGLAFGMHNGENSSKQSAEMLELSATYRAGLLMRWDGDGVSRLRHLRFELTPIIGAGVAQVDIDGSDASDPGLLLRYGLIFECIADWSSDWTTSASIGYMAGTAWVDWDNTSGSTVDLSGVTFRVGSGLHF